MESDTQPPATVTASTEEVYSSTEEHYTHQTSNVSQYDPTQKPSSSSYHDHTITSQELINASESVNDLPDGPVGNKTLHTTPTSQEGVAASSSMLNTISNLWTSAWGSWQRQ